MSRTYQGWTRSRSKFETCRSTGSRWCTWPGPVTIEAFWSTFAMRRNFMSCFSWSRLSFSGSLHVWRTSVWIMYRPKTYCCIGYWPVALLSSYLPVSPSSSKSALSLWKGCASFSSSILPMHWWRCPTHARTCWCYTLPSAFRPQHLYVSLANYLPSRQCWFLTF